jgi:hypothetical protein
MANVAADTPKAKGKKSAVTRKQHINRTYKDYVLDFILNSIK